MNYTETIITQKLTILGFILHFTTMPLWKAGNIKLSATENIPHRTSVCRHLLCTRFDDRGLRHTVSGSVQRISTPLTPTSMFFKILKSTPLPFNFCIYKLRFPFVSDKIFAKRRITDQIQRNGCYWKNLARIAIPVQLEPSSYETEQPEINSVLTGWSYTSDGG